MTSRCQRPPEGWHSGAMKLAGLTVHLSVSPDGTEVSLLIDTGEGRLLQPALVALPPPWPLGASTIPKEHEAVNPRKRKHENPFVLQQNAEGVSTLEEEKSHDPGRSHKRCKQ